jgi:PhnB protein
MQLQPYLEFNGQCEAAFKFYEQCLGGKIEAMMTHEGMPTDVPVPAGWRAKIMHASMHVGDTVLMGSDRQADDYKAPTGFHLSLAFKDPVEAERIFRLLAESGKIIMPIQQTFWSPKFGMLNDQFGVPWMVNTLQPA